MENKIAKEIIALNSKGYIDTYIATKLDINYNSVWRCRKKYKLKRNSKHENKKLSKIQKELITGSILGDGSLFHKSKKSIYPVFKIAHSQKQEEYFMFKYNILKNIMSISIRKYSKNNAIMSDSYNLKDLKGIYDKNYKANTRYIDYNFLMKNMTWFSLAILYFDDGNLCKRSGSTRIFMCNYSYNNLELFQKILLNKFKLDTTIQKHKQYYVIYFRVKSRNKLFKKITKYAIPSMRYKVLIKSDKLLEHPEEDNQQPIQNLNGSGGFND